MKDLNPEQKEAVLTTEGRLLILAGAGSGKTRVLTQRMAYLLLEKYIPAENILGLTFTNKAALEMKERLTLWVGQALSKKVTLCTFHSFCMKVLREYAPLLGYTRSFSLYSEKEIERLLTMIAKDLLGQEKNIPSLAPTATLLNKAKNKGKNVSEFFSKEKTWHDSFAEEVQDRMVGALRAYNAMDFDSLLSLTVQLFKEFPEVLARYQEQFKYVMIDEYQDTNPVQDALADLLTKKYGNLCVVGDDDQSIYGWRGAEVQNILQFKADKTIVLEENFRSTNTILKAANHVIKNNQKRHNKNLWSKKGDGEKIEIFHAPSEKEEAEAVVLRMIRLKEIQGIPWREMAILYRSNAISRTFEQALLNAYWMDGNERVRGIPYEIFGGLAFYERREIKDLLAYLRVVHNEKDEEAILRVINFPRRGVGDASLDTVTKWNREKKIPLWNVLLGLFQGSFLEVKEQIGSKAFQGIVQFVALIEETKSILSHKSLFEGVLNLIEKTGFKKAIEEEVKSEKMQEFKWENVESFLNGLFEFEEEEKKGEEKLSTADLLSKFLEKALLQGDFMGSKQKKGGNRVHLMTFHSSKGLEFPYCFLVGMVDHIMPHERSLKEGSLDEERRLMYVAITRAKEKSTLSMPRVYKKMGKEEVAAPSRFLFEIPKELTYISEWDK